MPQKKRYLLTETARRNLREIRAWSLAHWSKETTEQYFFALDQAATELVLNPNSLKSRPELAGGTGLKLHPVREHFLVYDSIEKNQIVIIAVIHQSRDVPAILSKGRHVIRRELDALKKKSRESK